MLWQARAAVTVAKSIGLALLVVILILMASSPRPGHSSPPPVMRLDPSGIKLVGVAGEKFTLDLIVDGAVNLGGFEARFKFDPNFIKLLKFEKPFLDLTTRPASCDQRRISESLAELRCNTEGEEPPGPSGKLVVARLKFTVQGLLVGKTKISVTSCNATDILGVGIGIKNCKGTNITINPPTPTATAPPHNLKLPQLQNLFLTKQEPKPGICEDSTDVAVFTHELDKKPGSPDPKDPGLTQRVAAFEMTVLFDERWVCVNLKPGQYAVDTGMVCFIDDSDEGLQPTGLARIGCTFTGKELPVVDQTLPLATLLVQPQPELYQIIRPNQNNGLVVAILNRNCNLADSQGHPIKKLGCDDSELTIRWLEGDVTGDCVVDVLDQQQLAFRWGTHVGSLLFEKRMDLEPSGAINGDGAIDIKDVQFVFGRHLSTCENPHPAQDPQTDKERKPKTTPTPLPTPTLQKSPLPTLTQKPPLTPLVPLETPTPTPTP